MDLIKYSEADIAAMIEGFIRTGGAIPADDLGFHREVNLLDAGYLDSLSLVALLSYLEETFPPSLTEDELFDPRFTTITGMAHLIAARSARMGNASQSNKLG